jgi:hypothetical protein
MEYSCNDEEDMNEHNNTIPDQKAFLLERDGPGVSLGRVLHINRAWRRPHSFLSFTKVGSNMRVATASTKTTAATQDIIIKLEAMCLEEIDDTMRSCEETLALCSTKNQKCGQNRSSGYPFLCTRALSFQ